MDVRCPLLLTVAVGGSFSKVGAPIPASAPAAGPWCAGRSGGGVQRSRVSLPRLRPSATWPILPIDGYMRVNMHSPPL